MRRVWIAVMLGGIAALGIAGPTGAAGGTGERVLNGTLSTAESSADAMRATQWNGKGDVNGRVARELRAPAQSRQVLLTYTGTTANDGLRIYRGRRSGLNMVSHPPAAILPGTPCVHTSRHKIRCAPRSVAAVLGNTGPGNDRLKVGKKVRRPIAMGGWWGRDKLSGGSGGDLLLGQNGKDRLRGKRGNDILCGGPGRDRVSGGPGKDRGCKALR